MTSLVDHRGHIAWGIYDNVIDQVNYLDYHLETPLGFTVPAFLKRLLANQFHFIGVIGPDIIAGLAIVDLKYLANGFFYLYDRKASKLMEATALSPSPASATIAPTPETPLSAFNAGGLKIDMTASRISAKAESFTLEAELDTAGATPLRICTRAGYRGWVYTQKTSPVRIRGNVKLEDRQIDIASPDTMALMDWTCGYMRRKTCWNWAAMAVTLGDGRTLGLNCSCGVNETSFTENAFWIDDVMTKVDTVNFIFDEDGISKSWRVVSYDRRVDLTFTPQTSRKEKINTGLVASRFTQLIGLFEGTLVTAEGEIIRIKDCPGFTEDHYAKW